MKVHNRPEYSHLLTEKQWAEKGRVLNPNVKGETMWTNQYCGKVCQYFDESETHEASSEELTQFWKPIKEKKKARNKALKKQKIEQTEKEIDKLKHIVET